ncbi:MAG TPA: ankyrin repeat domain-containing protein, partial [Coxiellaceae bacterium]|nr:ankyrin repeat domain-containing protein [Coxiellaceae bacterium]
MARETKRHFLKVYKMVEGPGEVPQLGPRSYRADVYEDGIIRPDQMAQMEVLATWLHRVFITTADNQPVVSKASLLRLGESIVGCATEEIPGFEPLFKYRCEHGQAGLVAVVNTPGNRHLLAQMTVAVAVWGNRDAQISNMGLSRRGDERRLTCYDFDMAFEGRYVQMPIMPPMVEDPTFGYRPSGYYDEAEHTWISIAADVRRVVAHILLIGETTESSVYLGEYCVILNSYRRYLQHPARHFSAEQKAMFEFPVLNAALPAAELIRQLKKVALKIKAFGAFYVRFLNDFDAYRWSDEGCLDTLRGEMHLAQEAKARGESTAITLQDEGYEAWLKYLFFPPALQQALSDNIATDPAVKKVTNRYLTARFAPVWKALKDSPGFIVFLRNQGQAALARIRAHYQGVWTHNKYVQHLFGDDEAAYRAMIEEQVSFAYLQNRGEALEFREWAEQYFSALRNNTEFSSIKALFEQFQTKGYRDRMLISDEWLRDVFSQPGDKSYKRTRVLLYALMAPVADWTDNFYRVFKQTRTEMRSSPILGQRVQLELLCLEKYYERTHGIVSAATTAAEGIDIRGLAQRALMVAIKGGHEPAVHALLVETSDTLELNVDTGMRLPLGWAAYLGWEPVIRRLLVQPRINPDAQDEAGDTALIMASSAGHEAVVRTLLANGANIHLKNKAARTALAEAAISGHETIVRALLAAETNSGDRRHALICALGTRHEAIAAIFVEGLDVSELETEGSRDSTPLVWAAYRGYATIVNALLAK